MHVVFALLRRFKHRSPLQILRFRHQQKMPPEIIVILGSTGTGKSKLGLEIAKRIGGEIISADSMQVYKGLDIVTNKVTDEEHNSVPHHMLDFLQPWQRFTVVDFRNKVLPIINNLIAKNKPIVIVGGTYYYVESILWKVLVTEESEDDSTLLYDRDPVLQKRIKLTEEIKNVDQIPEFVSVYQEDINSIPDEILHKHLLEIDNESGERIHFKERRKTLRALQIYEKTGNKLSELLKIQQSEDGGCSLGGPLRFPNAKVLWLQCDQDVLDKRLDDRVDEMVNKGLIDELIYFRLRYKQHYVRERSEYTSGIFQSIGLKEFHHFLELADHTSDEAQKLVEEGIEQLKVATRQYSRKQTKYIRNRFLRQPDRQVPPIYSLDVTNLELWDEKVLKPALKIISNHLEDNSIKPLERMEKLHTTLKTFHCPECNVYTQGDVQWETHLKSKRHHKRIHGLKKRELRLRQLK